ncbi:MAG: LysR family transcriptional regulator [Alphaproteobacteria bacterium]|nr:LysR family transcriptional regulator [Alphaproteobacteria bacterium]
MPTLSIRVDLRPGASIGPGKARLLELIAETGSISAAARAMEMSYRRAWLLIDDLKAVFGEAVVETAAGGAKGGGAHLTRRGRTVLDAFRRVERAAAKAAAREIARMTLADAA